MPPVAVAIGAAAAAYGAVSAASALGITAAITGTIAAALPSLAITVGGVASAIGFATFTAVSFIGNSLLSKKSKGDSPSFDATAAGQLISARNPVAPQRLIYGQVRSGGTPAFEGSHGSTGTNTPNSLLYIALAFTGHEAAELGDIYFDDVIVPLTSASHGFTSSGSRYDGTNSATGEQWVLLEKHLGTATDEASPLLLGAGVGWTAAHRGQGISKLVFRLANSVDIWPTGVPNITCVVKGKKVYDPRTESTGWSDNWALCVADWICDAKFGLGADYATEIDETALIAAANICDEVVNVSNESYAGSSDGVTLDITITTQRVPRIGDYFLIGSSNYYVTSVSERQRPGNEQRRFLVTFNTDLTNARLGFTASIPVGSITAIRVGEPRYTVNGIVDASRRRQDVLEDLRAAGAGAVIYQGGQWRILAGAWRAPTVTLDESDLRGPVRFQTKLSGRDGGNTKGIKGVFADPSALWQPTDYPAVANAGYVAPDNGDETWSDLDQPFAGSPSLCQRVAKIAAERLRRPINGTFPMKLTAFRVAAGDVVNLSLARYGWDSPLKAFEVQSWKFAIDQDDQGNPILGVDLTLRELDENAFAWSVTDEMPLPAAPATGLPDPWTVGVPGLALSDDVALTASGTVATRLILTITPPSDGFAGTVEAQFKKSSDSIWRSAGTAHFDGEVIEIGVVGIEDLVDYDARIRAINTFGVRSEWTQRSRQIVGQSSPPDDVENFTVNIVGDVAFLSWDPVSDIDLSHYRVRWSPSTTETAWGNAVDFMARVARPATSAQVPARVGTYFIKAVDLKGNESDNPTYSVTTIASLQGLNVVATQDEHPGWSGTKTDTAVASNNLRLDGGVLWDGLSGNWDDQVGQWDGLGGVVTEGTYEFDGPDLGAVYTSRVTASLKATADDLATTWDDIAGNWDDVPGFWDGETPSKVNVKLQIATTEDDPAGTPTWSDWRDFAVGDYKARAFKFKAVLTSQIASATPLLEELTVTVDMPDRVLSASGTTSAAANTTVSFSPAFKAAPEYGVTINDMASGDVFEKVSVSASSLVFNIKNAGSRVARSYSIVAKGYGRAA